MFFFKWLPLFIKIRTDERLFFTGVNATMHIQIAAIVVTVFVTVRSCERLFTGLNFSMFIHIGTFHELLSRVRTSKRLFTSVNSTMIVQVATFCGLLWTSCHSPDRRTAFHRCEFYDAYSIRYYNI